MGERHARRYLSPRRGRCVGVGLRAGAAGGWGGAGMHKYRLYVYDAEDRRIAPAMVISADNDETAAEQAENMLDGARAELGDGDRLVVRLPKK
jgi:hypothetical protein